MRKSELTKTVQAAKDKLNEFLEILLETQQEILKNGGSTFARNQLEKAKRILTKKITGGEIEDLLGRQQEINELKNQLTNLQIKEGTSQIQIPPKN